MKTPAGWRKDKLSQFFSTGFHNILASFDNKRHDYNILSELDDIFEEMTGNLINTRELGPALLFMRSHSAYRTACQLMLATQVPEAYVLCRSCIEYALYAKHIHSSTDAEEKWVRRHDNAHSKSVCRTEFSYRNILKTLSEIDHELSNTTNNLYSNFIDHGGHPNERAVTTALRTPKTESGFELKQLYFHGYTPAFVAGVMNVQNTGLCSLYIFRLIWKERFDICNATKTLDTINATKSNRNR